MSPETIGRYTVIRELGRGAMGVVFEASDPNLGRTVALKTVHANAIETDPEAAARRFKNEARAAGSLSHPNIVTVFDAGEQDGLLFIAMELLAGETLDAHLSQHRTVPLQRAIDITRQICDALDYANAKGIVHRDIKPANIILLPNGTVKITDFGLARTAEAITMTGQVMGTPHYMSPEQVRGRPVDGRSDLFSVGVMLYEMVTGERPFEGQSITTIMYKIVHETPTSPRALDASIPAGLSAVIERSMAKTPEERFQTGSELIEALENYNRFQPNASSASTMNVPPETVVASHPTVSAGITARPAKSRGKLLFAAVLVIVAAIVFFGVFHRGSKRSGADHNPTEVQAPVPPPSPSTSPSDQGTQSEAAQPSQSAAVVETHPATSGAPTASISVNSDPPTAAILLDHKPTGLHTPAQLQLSRGDHTILVEMDGFKPAAANVNVKGGESLEFSPRLTVQLPNVPGVNMPDLKKLGQIPQEQMANAQFWQQWARGVQQGGEGNVPDSDLSIMINTHPSGAHISINGGDTGKQSPAIIPAKPGTYRVRLDLDGYQSTDRKVKVKPGHPGMLNVTLKPANGNN
jgi:eukaryotic-like serine/threonine-protein kinase